MLQVAIVYMRDRALRCHASFVLVDSYYYKILAKCMLFGLVSEPIFALWRSFPQPRHVIYLDVDPATAWRRSGEGARLNAFEHYGGQGGREPFERFQADLRTLILREIRGLPVSALTARDDVDATAKVVVATVRQVIENE
jgi:thymidylate kinase